MEETWKDVKGFEGIYQISNFGRLKVLKRKVFNEKYFGNVKWVEKKEKIMKLSNNTKGYLHTVLTDNEGKRKVVKVHRLVAEAFIPNPNNYVQVNHIDGNKTNNCVDNLEWCTNEYNMKHSWRIGLRNEKTYFNIIKKIRQYDLEGNFIKEWNSAKEIEQQLGISVNMIRKCCNGKRNKTHNFIWKYL